ncbi:MAG: aminoacyl-tRNA hydrolase [Sedimentisphaerales bacterium]|nr:aminoacyl-tRNA hydrolase [Sedimentisphaerales bacterium]
MSQIEILGNIVIPEGEFIFKASRSSGPGGQNVNKLNTRISLFFNIKECDSFSDYQKKRILKCLSTRIDKEGCIRVVSQKFRTQNANRQAAIERLQELLEKALKPKPIRKKTKVPYSAKQKRLDEKKRRGKLKQQRSEKNFEN